MSSHLPPAPSRRIQRVTELLRREVSELLRRELNVEEVGLLSINEVKVAPDLKTATVFVGFVGNRQQRAAAPEKLATQRKKKKERDNKNTKYKKKRKMKKKNKNKEKEQKNKGER